MMITEHLLSGILITNANEKTKSLKYLIISLISSILADLPAIFSGGPGKIDYLSHRIYSHSLILLPLYTLIPTLLVFLFFQKKDFLILYLISNLSYLSHIFIDFLTPYGVQLFYPFSKTIFSADFFHCFDPIFIIISSSIIIYFVILVVYKRKYFEKKYFFIVISLLIGYSCFTGFSKIIMKNQFSSFLYKQNTEIKYKTTLPRTFWRWKGIFEDNFNYYVIIKENNNFKTITFNKNLSIPTLISKSKDYQKFVDYARFPIILKQDNTITFVNLIYSSNSYCLTFEIECDTIKNTKLTGFDFFDNY